MKDESLEGISMLEKAISLYGHFGNITAKARLILGEAMLWLSTVFTPHSDYILRIEGLKHIEQAFEYYRKNGVYTELRKAMLLYTDANWLAGNNERAIAVENEALSLAAGMNDYEVEAHICLVMAMSYRELFKLQKASEYFERAVKYAPYLATMREMLWLIFQRGILSYILGELIDSERFLAEAISICKHAASATIRVKIGECMTRSMLVVIYHYQGKDNEMPSVLPSNEMEKYLPEPFKYLNTLYNCEKENRKLILQKLDKWLRVRMLKLPGPMIARTVTPAAAFLN